MKYYPRGWMTDSAIHAVSKSVSSRRVTSSGVTAASIPIDSNNPSPDISAPEGQLPHLLRHAVSAASVVDRILAGEKVLPVNSFPFDPFDLIAECLLYRFRLLGFTAEQ